MVLIYRSFVIYCNSKTCIEDFEVHKSLWDFRPLWYSSQDGHTEGEHVKRGRGTVSFCPTLQVLDMLLSGVSALVVAQLSLEVLEGLMNYPV